MMNQNLQFLCCINKNSIMISLFINLKQYGVPLLKSIIDSIVYMLIILKTLEGNFIIKMIKIKKIKKLIIKWKNADIGINMKIY